MVNYCWSKSISRNPIYSIHNSIYSAPLSIILVNAILLIWLSFWYYYNQLIIPKLLWISYYDFSWLLLVNFYLFYLLLILWLIDYFIETFIAFTLIEQQSIINAIKLLIISEFMLFFCCFWSFINIRLISSLLLFLYFPLFNCYSFSIPFSNLIVLLFSSLPIQSSQLFIKLNSINYSIEGLTQTISCSLLFVLLQIKEFVFSYFSLSDCIIGSIYYITTGLHGFHVVIGSLCFFIMFIYLLLCYYWMGVAFLFCDFSFGLFLCTYYWHFVDFIWFIVFSLYIY